MTTKHDSLDAAIATVNKVVAEAVKKGWTRSVRSGGFKARPDAFSAVPVAPAARVKK